MIAARLLRPRASAQPGFAPAAGPVYLLALATASVTALLLPARGFALIGPDFEILGMTAGLLLVVGCCLRARGFGRIGTVLEAWTLMTAFCVVMSMLLFVLAANDRPLIDAPLAAADRWLVPGFDWPATMTALARHPRLIDAATACYASLRWQPALLLIACAAAGRQARCWTFLAAWMATLIVTAVLFAMLPAIGPYAYFALPHAAFPAMSDPAPWHTPGLVAGLRDGSLRAFGLTDLDGIVTFPSFHTAAAVLLAWGFWPLRPLRAPMLALNLAMMAAAVPVGGHHLVDILAGVAVAATGIAVARRLPPADQSPNTRAKIVSTCL